MALSSKPINKVRNDIPLDEVAPKEEIVRINLNVPKSVRAKWKTYAAQQDKALTEIIIETMNAHMSK